MENKKGNLLLIFFSFIIPIVGIFIAVKYKSGNPEFYKKIVKALVIGTFTWIITLFIIHLFTGISFLGIDGNGFFSGVM